MLARTISSSIGPSAGGWPRPVYHRAGRRPEARPGASSAARHTRSAWRPAADLEDVGRASDELVTWTGRTGGRPLGHGGRHATPRRSAPSAAIGRRLAQTERQVDAER